MINSENFLRRLANDEVVGDFYPFDTGKINEVEDYIKQIVDKLRNNHQIKVEPDFEYYGSGFASYISIRISKKNNSDTKIKSNKNQVVKITKGILLYISNLSPYWYYGGSEWSVSTINGNFSGRSSGFIHPDAINRYNKEIWEDDLNKIKLTLSDFNYNLLTKEELEKTLDFEISLESNLMDGAPKVFDCFFHWED